MISTNSLAVLEKCFKRTFRNECKSSGPENRHRAELLFQTSLCKAFRHRSPPWLTSHVRNLASWEVTYTNCRSDNSAIVWRKETRQKNNPYPTHVYNARVAHATSLPHRVEHCVMPFIPDYRANRASASLHSDELRGYLSALLPADAALGSMPIHN